MHELATLLHRLLDRRTYPAVLATLVSVAGSSYRRAGARLLIDATGERLGSISGGCLEEDVRTHAAEIVRTGQPKVVTYDTTSENDLVWGVGLGCHGVVDVFLENLSAPPAWATILQRNLEHRHTTDLAVVWRADDPAQLGTRLASELPDVTGGAGVFRQTLHPPPALYVFGAGDDAQPLVQLAKVLGWQVIVADPRAEFATPDRFPTADRLVVAPAARLVEPCAPPADACAVVMTHRYVHDVPILKQLFARTLNYVGLLGPKKRATRILADLANEGVHPIPQRLGRFHAPVGLDLGADSPQEVALSIVAEIQASLGGRDARPLREREKPIHG
ncbi:XdhC family protein [Opitutus terrae]|uniref:Alanine dehydrogenase n=1 Tax=Opitutus terrae (strain DSM 11246 / JCM 15787 / PB90-1) TaxID=452637 RepID=B1ZUF5_OPITP|nr:XdhC/CoxI family protein [Opitutus terrae]ACB73998.1 Alanine dehydrogenase [Opitutus terrae PB90-1]